MDEKKIFKEAFIKSLKTYEEKKRLSMTPEELEIEEYENAMFEAGESSATEISPEEQREMQAKAFAMNLAKFRKERGLMQSELAAALGLTQSRITEYERGVKMPRLKRLQAFAEFFGCEISDLIDVSSMFGTMEDLTYNDYIEVIKARHPGTKFITIGGCIPYERSEALGKIMAAIEKMNDYELTQYYMCALQLLEDPDQVSPGITNVPIE